ncbi:xylulokinase [Actinobacteria bacterium YIM 96077]|uniref:Xylulose kinase n=1 Tax=Phytoactinopolyspora halophila TaxID=1981511 RepID=A0A329QS71_9ACTN|nr:xylulokinase [Phytoactinopolyspora halophila]AYY15622.1 xylulokinase [Actinobacteria bacterium YIM 96077]RAW14891.1 xylulokinase [Phytoactinopolyspora halophila]
MALVAGIDSSTQSCKVVLVDADTGAIVETARADHPDGTEVDPRAWWEALEKAGDGLLDRADAVAVGGQQHGMVTLDSDGEIVRPALLWNDTRSAGAARELTSELGGPQEWADTVGIVPVASFTVTKLRWLAREEPEAASRVTQVMLPHDWLTWQLMGKPDEAVTDRGDASGTGYWSAATGEYRPDLLELAFGRRIGVPRVAGPSERVGTTASGAAVAPGTGDNMGAALGLGMAPGDVAVSIGTSGTVFATSDVQVADGSGIVAGFADATGRHLPLVCTLNAARVMSATATMLGVDLPELDRLALQAAPGAGGLVLLPYLDGERTPDLPDATGTLTGLTREAMTPANVARATVEGMLCGLADGVDALRAHDVPVERVLLIGGGAQSAAVREVAPDVFGVPVAVPTPGEYVALGAARQAAWALVGGAEPPAWDVEIDAILEPKGSAAGIRENYASARQHQHPSTR